MVHFGGPDLSLHMLLSGNIASVVLTSMSDSDWQGPLKSRSTEGQARS